MTTLNLVLTNEINDILEEKQRLRELEDADNSNEDDDDDDMGMPDEEEEKKDEETKDDKDG